MKPLRLLALLLVMVATLSGCDLLFPPMDLPGGLATPMPAPAICPPGDPDCFVVGGDASVSGTVRGPGGEPVPNVTVGYVLPGGGGAASSSESDPGRYSISVPSGKVTLTWQAPGYTETSRTLNLALRQELKLDVTLQRAP